MPNDADDDKPGVFDIHNVATRPSVPVERPTVAMPPVPRPHSDSDVSVEQRRHDAEMRMLRSADAQQSKILSEVMAMVSRLEGRQAESEERLHERLATLHNDLEEIKLALYAYRKD